MRVALAAWGLLALLAAHALADPPPTHGDCGTTSPLDNSCDAGLVLIKHLVAGRANITADVLGFVGHLRVELRSGDDVFARDFDAVGQALELGGFQDSGRADADVLHATCTASGLRGVYTDAEHDAGYKALPAPLPVPLGPWHCYVNGEG